MSRLLAFALAVALLPAAALADIIGPARVIDGDTLEIHSHRIRLYRIDAPEKKQPCELRGVQWGCGIVAWGELVQLTAEREVECDPRDVDR